MHARGMQEAAQRVDVTMDAVTFAAGHEHPLGPGSVPAFFPAPKNRGRIGVLPCATSRRPHRSGMVGSRLVPLNRMLPRRNAAHQRQELCHRCRRALDHARHRVDILRIEDQPHGFRPRCGAYSQFSALTPAIRTNSRMLLVTTISPSLRAWPAICMSCDPHGVPARSSSARTCP